MTNSESKYYRNIDNVLSCVICGFKQGGTTFFSQLLSAHPMINGRFEIGILSAKKPQEIINIDQRILENIKRHWKVSDDVLVKMSNQDSFYEAYKILLNNSDIVEKNSLIYDKFPDYILNLETICENSDIPIFVIVRDPAALYWSRKWRVIKRHGESRVDDIINPERFVKNYNNTCDIIFNSKKYYDEKIHIYVLEDVVDDLEYNRKKIFDKLNLEIPTDKFGNANVSNEKVRDGVDVSVKTEYKNKLNINDINYIYMNTRYNSSKINEYKS